MQAEVSGMSTLSEESSCLRKRREALNPPVSRELRLRDGGTEVSLLEKGMGYCGIFSPEGR